MTQELREKVLSMNLSMNQVYTQNDNTYGVINLLLDKTTAIPYEVDESELIEVIDIVETNNSGFKEGDNVIYTKGINSKIIGILKNKLNNNRAILILSILGKNQEVSVSLNNLQKII